METEGEEGRKKRVERDGGGGEREGEICQILISKEAVGNSWDILCTTLGHKSYRQVL